MYTYIFIFEYMRECVCTYICMYLNVYVLVYKYLAVLKNLCI